MESYTCVEEVLAAYNKNYMAEQEALAAYAHEAWSGWMKYMFEKSIVNSDGSLTIPEPLVKRWARQATTLYQDLPESEKESDRDEAKKIITISDEY